MGSSMGRALARSGFDVVCWNRTAPAAQALADELGGRSVERPADVAREADICVSMLADGAAVETTYRGADGLFAGAHAGSVLIDSSTVAPSTLLGLAADARAVGAGLLDAPVSGSVSLAEAGSLTIMVGGEAAHVEAARPVLDALAAKVFHLGPLGTGAAMKLAVNALIFGLNEALAEGLVLAEAAGIDRALAYDVLTASAAGAPYVGYKRGAFLDPAGEPVAFALDLAAKDLRLIAAFAGVLDVPVPQATTNLRVIEDASVAHGGDRDFSAVAEHLRESIRTKEGRPA